MTNINFSNPLVTMNRVLTQPYSFKCSPTSLPSHCMTSGPSAAIATDPTIFPEPSTFDGHRYRRMRTEHKDAESSMVMGMSTIDSLGFGLGNQACPGRFFAVNNMKLIMAKMLTQYELTLEKDGMKYTGPRPQMTYNDFSVQVPKNFSLRVKKL